MHESIHRHLGGSKTYSKAFILLSGDSEKRDIMKLTRRMKLEMNSMQEHLFYLKATLNNNEEEIIQQLEAYKVIFENFFYEIDDVPEKVQLLRKVNALESTFNRHAIYKIPTEKSYISDESDRYARMALEIEPNDVLFNQLHGEYLRNLQDEFFEETTPSTEWDYTFIDYFQKAYENENNDSALKRNIMITLRKAEARRDYYNGMIKEIKDLEQFDCTPNLELTEPKCEIYKITINGSFVCGKGTIGVDKKNTNPNCGNIYCNHRVLFQNEGGNINMGAWFTDPVNDVYDIHWFQVLELEMDTSVIKNEGLISIDDELGTWSCFVELHRNGVLRFFIMGAGYNL